MRPITLLGVALVAASCNVATCLLLTVGDLQNAPAIATSLAVGLAAILVALAGPAALSSALLRDRRRELRRAVGGGLGLAVILASIAIPTVLREMAAGETLVASADPTTAWILGGALGALVLLAGVAGGVSVYQGRSRWLVEPDRLALVAIACIVALWLASWWRARPGWDDSPLAGALLGASWLGCVGALVLGYRHCRVAARSRAAGGILVALGLAIFLAPPALSAAAGLLGRRGEPAGDRPPLVLVVTVDTLRQDVVGAERDGASLTPRLDELARQGAVFARARTPGPWTRSAMASLFTGLSPLVHGVTRPVSVLPDAATTFAEILGEAGYRTVGIGTNPHLMPSSNIVQGFDQLRLFPFFEFRVLSLGSLVQRALGFAHDGSTRHLTELAVDAIESRRGDEALLVWLHYFDPHQPYEPPPEYLRGTPPATVGTRFDAWRQVRSHKLDLSIDEKAWVRRLYEAELRFVDASLGTVLDAVRAQGIWDESLIVVTSDHGEELWDHGSIEHGHTLYEELVRVPLILKLPAQRHAGRRVEVDVSTESLTPTLLELLAIDARRRVFTSPSLVPLLDDEGSVGATWPPVLGSGVLYYGDRHSVVTGGIKYIEALTSDQRELYSLSDDPAEQVSIAGDEEALAATRARLEELRAEHAEIRDRLGLVDESTRLEGPELDALRSLGYVH